MAWIESIEDGITSIRVGIQWIRSVNKIKTNHAILAIYPVDSAIYSLTNWGLIGKLNWHIIVCEEKNVGAP